jgi:hypothetical protein
MSIENPFELIDSRLLRIEKILTELRLGNNDSKATLDNTPIKGIHNLAKFLKISSVTCQKLKNSGKIPYVQFGRTVIFIPSQVLHALSETEFSKRKNHG